MYHFFHSFTFPVPSCRFSVRFNAFCVRVRVRVSLSFQSLWLGNACDVNKCEKRNVAQDVLTSRRAKCKSNRYIILPSKNHIFKMISGEWKCGRYICIYLRENELQCGICHRTKARLNKRMKSHSSCIIRHFTHIYVYAHTLPHTNTQTQLKKKKKERKI